jgi:hypothetical protein
MAGFARAAAYYAPADDDPLARAAAVWLGRAGAQPDLPDIAAVTADARLYGFHATLKPPMALAAGTDWDGLRGAARAMAASIAPFDLPPLAVSDIHGFLALRETAPCPPLQALADRCVAELDRFRAPPNEAELARRRRTPLTPEQDAMLVRWGYPYVFGTWFFHMTLTRRLTPAERAVYQPAAEAHFAAALARPRRVRDVCLFVQAEPGGPFAIAERLPLLG